MTESVKTETDRTVSAKAEPDKAEPVSTEPVRAESANPEPADRTRPDTETPRQTFPLFAFLRRHWLRHLWLVLDVTAMAEYFILRNNRFLMNTLTSTITQPLQRALGRISYTVPFSVMELLAVLTVLLVILYILYSVREVLRAKGHRAERVYTLFLSALCVFLTIEVYFCFLWAVSFRADNFQDKSGLRARPVTTEELTQVTAYFAHALSSAADGVERDENGVFRVPKAEILRKAPEIYDNLEQVYPFLAFDDVGVKPMFFSRIMSRMDFTGFYCSYTGEANVNVDSPACLLPSTAAHEMAHQRGFSSEQECNFLAVLACVTSGDPVYTYSGFLMGYIYLGNALYDADPDAWRTISRTLPDTVRADLRDNNAYWDQFRDTLVQTVSENVYDAILKGYGDERGTRSYGAMVDLLIACYAPLCQ